MPISTHTDALQHGGDGQQAIFAEEGVDLELTIIGHPGDTTEIAYLKRLTERGSTIGMDRFGLEHNGPQLLASFAERVEIVAELCKGRLCRSDGALPAAAVLTRTGQSGSK